MTHVYDSRGVAHGLETVGAWLLGAFWILPLLYAFWTAFHPGEFSTRFVLTAPLTLDNFARAWQAAESLGDWTLTGCTVAPGFSFDGFELAPKDWKPR